MRKLLLILFSCSVFLSSNAQNSLVNAWDSVPVILSRVQAPTFPDASFNINSYGAVEGGITLATTAINNAIIACSAAGGGKVIVPAGTYLTGAIHLRNNVNLYLSKGAILKFSITPIDYLPTVLTRFEGVECYNYSPFIYAYEQENIAITGPGTLDGNASAGPWLNWKYAGDADRNALFAMGENGTPVDQRVFGANHYIRPVFIQPHSCKNVLIDSVTVINSPMWEINPVLCENVTVSNVTISSHGVNNDGCNPECCKDVWIHHCTFDTGDDCIAIKSGRNNDGRRVNVPSQNIVIQKCTMMDGHGGVVLGSEISGSVRNVFAEDCVMNSSNLERALRVKTNSVRGGVIENIHLRNIQVGQVATAYIEVNMNYEEGDAGSFTPIVRNFSVQNLSGTTSPKVFNINCYARSPLTGLLLKDCDLTASSLGSYTNIRKLQVVNSTVNGTAPLLPTASTSYQHAELYSSKNNWGWSNVQPSFTGTGYMEPCDVDNSIEYTVDMAAAEQDKLSFNYTVMAPSVANCSIYVNNIFKTTLSFTPSSSTWGTQDVLLNLPAGVSTIKLVADTVGLCIDQFTRSYYGPFTSIKDNQFAAKQYTVVEDKMNGSYNLHFVAEESEILQTKLFDLSGNCLQENQVLSLLGDNSIRIANSLAQGVYVLQITGTNGSNSSIKFIAK